ncbi:hypothetical protein, partial [Iamia sp.]|uniref:hypothetical protein n=1 Tax=Iamia sp. TaxID=2722710 RepID=UPI002BBE4EA8
AITLAGEVARYGDIGTENQRALDTGYNRIVYDDLPPSAFMEIGGVRYTGAEVNAMSDDERYDLADAWVADWEGQYAGEPTLAAYKAERDAFKGSHDMLTDYTTYKSWVYNEERNTLGLRGFRQEIEAKQPDSEFARAVGDKRAALAKQGHTGEELEERLDTWAASDEGYNAIMGVQSKGGTETGAVVYPQPASEPWIQVPTSDGKYGSKDSEGSSTSRFRGSRATQAKGGAARYAKASEPYVSPWATLP